MAEGRKRSGRREQRRAETRQRIVDAAIQLHSTIGPARTSYSAVAQRAGVTRPTLYSYFPDKMSLFAACTGQVMATDPPPDVRGWPAEGEPIERLRTALTAMYAYYRRHAERIANLERDMPRMHMAMPPGPTIQEQRGRMAEGLATKLVEPDRDLRPVAAAIRHAMAFSTWFTLTQPPGATDDEAVELMVDLVEIAGRREARHRIGKPRVGAGRTN